MSFELNPCTVHMYYIVFTFIFTSHVRTFHQTVISVEHFAIASADFFVLLAGFAVQRKE